MSLVIEQYFPLGRFHATRWRENAFADAVGEWPPSPWRLLRTLAARWFEYSRETGDLDHNAITNLLRVLAVERPSYQLPESAVKAPIIKQYQPVSDQSWSDPSAGSGAVKKSKTTLVPDSAFLVDPEQPVVWHWLSVDLTAAQRNLLGELLSRITYFGRAESISHLRISTNGCQPNCFPTGGSTPVLCFAEQNELNLQSLLCDSDKEPLRSAPIPPGTAWVYYQRPDTRTGRRKTVEPKSEPIRWVQFAVGGHLLPRPPLWIKITERFRGRVLKQLAGFPDFLPMLSGKDRSGNPLTGEHDHAFYLLWPDEDKDNPTKLVVWRRNRDFHPREVEAMLTAASRPIFWADDKAGWTAQLIPLPARMALPKLFSARSRVWESVTPFVRPHNRHFRRANGKARDAEAPTEVCARLIEKVWGIRPISVLEIGDDRPWMKLHETAAMRQERRAGERRTPHVGPGHYLRVTFESDFQGPLIVGDSAHFGLGVFGAAS